MSTGKDYDMSDPPKPHIGSHSQPLPQELMDIVLEGIEDVDILSLRATCRSVAGQVQDAFLNRYFAERRHLITEFSLRRLVDICKNNVLSSRLKSIEFVHVELNEQWSLDLFDSDTTNAESLIGMYDHTRWLEWQAQHRDFLHECALEIIVSALKMLKDKTVPSYPALRISADAQCPRLAYGLHELHLSLGIDPVANQKCDKYYDILTEPFNGAPETTRLLLKSIVEAHFEVRDLILSNDYLRPSFADLNLGAHSPGLHSSLSQLRRLSIDFSWDTGEEEDPEDFANFLTAATSLEHVSVKFSGVWLGAETVPSAIVSAFRSNRLSSIDLASALFEHSDLADLLVTQHQTLCRLAMSDIRLRDEESWAPLLRKLETDFTLKWINLQSLMNGDLEECFGSGPHEGETAVQSALEALVKAADKALV